MEQGTRTQSGLKLVVFKSALDLRLKCNSLQTNCTTLTPFNYLAIGCRLICNPFSTSQTAPKYQPGVSLSDQFIAALLLKVG